MGQRGEGTKYGSGSSEFSVGRRTRSVSSAWKSIGKTAPFVNRHTKWSVGDGSLVKVWEDWWDHAL